MRTTRRPRHPPPAVKECAAQDELAFALGEAAQVEAGEVSVTPSVPIRRTFSHGMKTSRRRADP